MHDHDGADLVGARVAMAAERSVGGGVRDAREGLGTGTRADRGLHRSRRAHAPSPRHPVPAPPRSSSAPHWTKFGPRRAERLKNLEKFAEAHGNRTDARARLRVRNRGETRSRSCVRSRRKARVRPRLLVAVPIAVPIGISGARSWPYRLADAIVEPSLERRAIAPDVARACNGATSSTPREPRPTPSRRSVRGTRLPLRAMCARGGRVSPLHDLQRGKRASSSA